MTYIKMIILALFVLVSSNNAFAESKRISTASPFIDTPARQVGQQPKTRISEPKNSNADQAFANEIKEAIKDKEEIDETIATDLADEQPIWNSICDDRDQKTKGIQVFHYSNIQVMGVCVRIGQKTWFEFPKWEVIQSKDIVLGETSGFEKVKRSIHSFTIKPNHFGADTSLHVMGSTGQLYTFMLKAVGTKFENPTDATVFILSDEPENYGESKDVTVTDIDQAKEEFIQAQKEEKPDYKRQKPFNWDVADCDNYKVFIEDGEADELLPKRVCTDGFWTLIDLGSMSDSKRRLLVYEVVDGTDQPIDPQTIGRRDQVIMIPRIGNFTLGVGDVVICLRHVGRLDQYEVSNYGS